ncbi:phage tail sheath subtilisin-like domain-containing protein [Streptomyces canus]|uniref:phage tail sheath family protein n=1 Tax=Streptomyces canus TaxID=58343 RepID=UPI00224CF59C|nr:phage tail sheath subtilisin-like domain-containing protein [Streptomyces canus]MCX4857525.1 phage tail sheath subtilisin-like domain-containing protein [Streptomyces canus]WSW37130.1 phage tail sheath subtilisin-like domain-containing protein [Streptomyces canus]
MTQPPIPGVLRQDVFPSPAPVFLTGVPVFLGRAVTGPRTPQRLTVWPQFEAAYGAAPGGFLADAVRGFFDNGGLLCHVVRLDESKLPAAALQAALDGLDDDVDLVCAPDIVAAAPWPTDGVLGTVLDQQRVLLRHCRERGDRFALLDGVPTTDTTKVTEQRVELTRTDGSLGSFGALYYPWLWAPGEDGGLRHLPPSGHVAGVYSVGDQRVGVHKAPANTEVEGVVDLQVRLAPAEVGELYAQGVNCLRALPGRGVRVWGARTLATEPELAWRDVSARRLVGTIGRWVERFMTGLVHEPNDVRLWVRIMRELTAYLDELFQRGALKGRTAAEAFFVKCDHETNPPEAVEAGVVVTQIGVAPTVPAEFITVRVIHGASGVTVDAA